MPRSVAFAITARSTARASDGHSIGGSIVGATILSSFSAFHGLYRGGQHYSSAADARVVLFSARARICFSAARALSPSAPHRATEPGQRPPTCTSTTELPVHTVRAGPEDRRTKKTIPLSPSPARASAREADSRLGLEARGGGSSRFADRSAVLGAPLPLPCAFLKKLKPSKPPLHP